MLGIIDKGHVGALVLLDMSAAFDTVDHAILANVLQRRFGIQGQALDWFTDFTADRTQSVLVADTATASAASLITCGVPQGSVLGPKQFISYTEDVADFFTRRGLPHHQYADDIQTIGHGPVGKAPEIAATVRDCIVDLQTWCSSRRLQLNASKTEIMWFGTAANLNRLQAAHKCITIGSAIIEPSLVVRDLGVFFDAELTMHDHVMRVAQTCFYHLRPSALSHSFL
jgi:hypothetical protein